MGTTMTAAMDGMKMSSGMSNTAMWTCVALMGAVLVVVIAILVVLLRIHGLLRESRSAAA